jgi:hypothetical protein
MGLQPQSSVQNAEWLLTFTKDRSKRGTKVPAVTYALKGDIVFQ